jgi:fucose 4-O-acetylase-like acetyltransferase
MRLFPTAAQIEAGTPADRDRSIDFWRIVSLAVVVVGHLLLVVLYFGPDGRLHAAGALDDSKVLPWVTWVLQVMPLFFFAGGAATVNSVKPDITWGGWLLARCQRLYRPTLWFVVVITALVLVCQLFAPPEAMSLAVPQVFVLLWFLGVYTVCLAFVPLLARITTWRQLALVVVGLYALIVLVDRSRFWHLAHSPSPDNWHWGVPNFLLVWLIPTTIGVGYRKGLIPRPAGAALFALALGADLALSLAGPYTVEMLGPGDDEHISNFTPPSLLMAGQAILLCGLAVAVAPALNRILRRPRLWQIVTIGNTGAMTLYLWHWVVLFAMDGALIVIGLLPHAETSPGLWPSKAEQLPLYLVLVFLAFVLLQPLENKPLPWWDARVSAPGWRSPLVGALVIVAGISTLALARLGPQGYGLLYAVGFLGSLALARSLAIAAPRGAASP